MKKLLLAALAAAGLWTAPAVATVTLINTGTFIDLGAAPLNVQALTQPVVACVQDSQPSPGTACSILNPGSSKRIDKTDNLSHVWVAMWAAATSVASGPAQVAEISGGLTGFQTTQYGTPITAVTTGATGSIPSTPSFVITNVGAYPAYCAFGATVSTSNRYIQASGGTWGGATPTGATQLTCMGIGSTTTINFSGGTGLAISMSAGGSSSQANNTNFIPAAVVGGAYVARDGTLGIGGSNFTSVSRSCATTDVGHEIEISNAGTLAAIGTPGTVTGSVSVATPLASNALTFATLPAGIVPGMIAYDTTTTDAVTVNAQVTLVTGTVGSAGTVYLSQGAQGGGVLFGDSITFGWSANGYLTRVPRGTLSEGTINVAVTYVGGNDGLAFQETTPSATATYTPGSSNELEVRAPPIKSGAYGWNVYAGTGATLYLQNSYPLAFHLPWIEPSTGLVTGTATPPISDTTGYAGPLKTVVDACSGSAFTLHAPNGSGQFFGTGTAHYTASIAGTVMAVTALTANQWICAGEKINNGAATGSIVFALTNGKRFGCDNAVGNYTATVKQTVASEPMTGGSASYTASITDTILDVSVIASGTICVGDPVNGTGVVAGTVVYGLPTGALSGCSTEAQNFLVTAPQTLSSTALTSPFSMAAQWAMGVDDSPALCAQIAANPNSTIVLPSGNVIIDSTTCALNYTHILGQKILGQSTGQTTAVFGSTLVLMNLDQNFWPFTIQNENTIEGVGLLYAGQWNALDTPVYTQGPYVYPATFQNDANNDQIIGFNLFDDQIYNAFDLFRQNNPNATLKSVKMFGSYGYCIDSCNRVMSIGETQFTGGTDWNSDAFQVSNTNLVNWSGQNSVYYLAEGNGTTSVCGKNGTKNAVTGNLISIGGGLHGFSTGYAAIGANLAESIVQGLDTGGGLTQLFYIDPASSINNWKVDGTIQVNQKHRLNWVVLQQGYAVDIEGLCPGTAGSLVFGGTWSVDGGGFYITGTNTNSFKFDGSISAGGLSGQTPWTTPEYLFLLDDPSLVGSINGYNLKQTRSGANFNGIYVSQVSQLTITGSNFYRTYYALDTSALSSGMVVFNNNTVSTSTSPTSLNVPSTLGGTVSVGTDNVLDLPGGTPSTALNYPTVIGEDVLPLIMPPSGSVASNGALTLNTALDSAYANAYVYMPANSITGTNAAGWYYAQMSGTPAASSFTGTIGANFTANTAATTLTVTAVANGFFCVGDTFLTGVSTAGTTISTVPTGGVTALGGVGSGTCSDATGSYTLSKNVGTIVSQAMTTSSTYVGVAAGVTGTIYLNDVVTATGIPTNDFVVSLLGGTIGSTGIYSLSAASTAVVNGTVAGSGYVSGTLFQNTYSSGSPTVPGSPTAWSGTTGAAYTGTTGATVALSIPVSANTMGSKGKIVTQFLFSNNYNTNSKSMTAVFASTGFGSTSNTTQLQCSGQSSVQNRGVTNAQVGVNVVPCGGFTTSNSPPTFGAVDTTASQNTIIKLNLANAKDWMILQSATVQLVPGI